MTIPPSPTTKAILWTSHAIKFTYNGMDPTHERTRSEIQNGSGFRVRSAESAEIGPPIPAHVSVIPCRILYYYYYYVRLKKKKQKIAKSKFALCEKGKAAKSKAKEWAKCHQWDFSNLTAHKHTQRWGGDPNVGMGQTTQFREPAPLTCYST